MRAKSSPPGTVPCKSVCRANSYEDDDYASPSVGNQQILPHGKQRPQCINTGQSERGIKITA
uniref:Uncharacterized protein n=1 Tax=Anguilla anguilla TaxID=7936 RepID=A0A0E9RF19_ANGAN